MKLKQLMFLVLGVGIISSIAIVYFYIIQKDFTKQHREFLLSVNALENAHIDLEHQILQNSIYSYHNQDEISATINQVENTYIELAGSKILNNKTYLQTKNNLLSLQADIRLNLQNIEEYIMLNAGIKNSLVFLSRRIENASFLEKDDRALFIQSIKILKHFNDAKRMQDLDYINHNNFLLKSDSKNPKTQSFVENFNLHSKYLINRYPIFVQTTKTVLNSDIHNYLEKVKKEFSAVSVNDFKALDMFAFILFSLFISSLSLVVVLFIKYIKENQKLEETTASLEHSLSYDHLTDLHNRRAFEIQLKKITEPHLLIINIDGFKYINDIYGNDVGNVILQELAQILKDEFSNRPNTCIYRLGGDEFGILFNKISSENALEIAKKLEKKISNYDFIVYDLTLHLLVSIASNSTVPILENTDLALKLLKKDHTLRILEYNDNLNIKTDVKDNMNTIELIKTAVSNDRIVPFFQPIINLKTSKIEKYEALVRLKLENGTFLPPFKFLDISKKSSYYHFITKTMIEKTLKMAQEFPQYRFSINISMIDILDAKLTHMLFEILNANPEVAKRLDIELLESENLQNLQVVQDFITKLHAFGSKILVDDFGTGYSNFSYFSNLDIDLVKIDGSIVSEIETDNKKLHMVTSIHKFSNGMNMKNVAEFVETREVALLLKEIGIEYAQGYYFSQPLERPLENDEVVI
ncbi:diguanylate cyclase/phosphodiesterase (GGDEF & EAL domains) [Sulfurimonas gotlandica GD1]|uniref:Diguanylate cyclase/phosphodiesterase (GGDEF & EAL domains) n=1 Tax=Sulfurimonas gotlandica (strain DSM 19862 / JCM 16533 / GD1) TaxID=929558 RepID=B6BGA1_SULGG|nr:EAL domain-containing protein [Sulfurimonas gotlandica]EDZ63407.1 diguanylate cyclase/phosphodiesterase [Sulfurimonas gotlandica GD1]EHP29526.1 diguanylate cyclase/phosphodiesterase (GGDEF & EAL domains) [Sulfurimonas gotlandica GD1]